MLPSLTETQRIAEVARQGLRMVAAGEDKTIEGWLVYGAALNEGRKLHGGEDRAFGKWVALHQLDGVNDMDRLAAMWAAADEATFEETRRLHPRVRTVRSLHAKWKEAQRPAEEPNPTFEEPTEAERETVRKLRAIYDDPAADPYFKENVKRKLDTYEVATPLKRNDARKN